MRVGGTVCNTFKAGRTEDMGEETKILKRGQAGLKRQRGTSSYSIKPCIYRQPFRGVLLISVKMPVDAVLRRAAFV